MNITARALSQGTALTTGINIRALVFSQAMLCTTALVTSILLSALGLIYTKDLGRSLVSDVAHLQHLQNILQMRQDQLLLEENTLTAQGRLEYIAENQLHMAAPKTNKIILGAS